MRQWCMFAAALTLVACAASPAPAPQTAAQDEIPPAREPDSPPAGAAAAGEASSNVAAGDERPAGNLVCRTVTDTGGKTELFLDWNGSEADGTLREIAPSGMVHEKKVHAERQQGLVVADDIYEKDLVAHAAIVAERGGKKVMKVDNAWVRCE